MKPDLDAVAEGFDTVDLVVIDAAADPEAAKALRVFGSPTLIAVRDGVELARFTGRRTRAELENLFQETAAGDPATLARTSHSDRVVGTVAGVGVAGVGLALGPAWLLVAFGAAIAVLVNLPRMSRPRRWSRRK
jgi:hypothetical protein